MDWNNIKNSITSFILHIPTTLKETSIWFLISYIIPIVNVGILWAIKRKEFIFDLPVLNIVIVTNACFLTALIYQTSITGKKRKLINTTSIITLIITVVLFSVSIIEIEKKEIIFAIDIYEFGAIGTLIISVLLGLISKYDEVEAESKDRAKKGKEINSTTIGNKQIKL